MAAPVRAAVAANVVYGIMKLRVRHATPGEPIASNQQFRSLLRHIRPIFPECYGDPPPVRKGAGTGSALVPRRTHLFAIREI